LGAFWYLKKEIDEDNVVSSEMIQNNQTPYSVVGEEALNFPWSDSLDNLDPENNGNKRLKNWNFRKVQLRGYFKKKAILGL
jgi:hypothetical protein